jgi:hypothetical protein
MVKWGGKENTIILKQITPVSNAHAPISLFQIAKELELNNYNSTYSYTTYNNAGKATPISLKSMSTATGGFEAINTNNALADRPNGDTPHTMAEFYNYDHDVGFVP